MTITNASQKSFLILKRHKISKCEYCEVLFTSNGSSLVANKTFNNFDPNKSL